jgi:hypothetical protein
MRFAAWRRTACIPFHFQSATLTQAAVRYSGAWHVLLAVNRARFAPAVLPHAPLISILCFYSTGVSNAGGHACGRHWKQSGWVATCPSRQRKNFRSNICPSGKIILRFYPGIGIFSSVNAFSRDAPLLFQQLAQGRVFQPPGLRGGILLADRPRKGCALQ